MYLGWLTPIEITNDGLYQIEQSFTTTDVYMVSSGLPEGEYFLIENKNSVGWDVNMWGGGGIVIWLIDESFNDVSASGARVSVVQADGRDDLENAVNMGDEGDIWKFGGSKDELSDEGYPNTKSKTGQSSGIRIYDFSANGSTMSFRISGVGPALEATPSPTSRAPTRLPTKSPTPSPTQAPSQYLTKAPTRAPTRPPEPTGWPTPIPTKNPTADPTPKPTEKPSKSPIATGPSPSPTREPTKPPKTMDPTISPADSETDSPTEQPTDYPTTSPSKAPSSSEKTPAPTSSPTITSQPSGSPAPSSKLHFANDEKTISPGDDEKTLSPEESPANPPFSFPPLPTSFILQEASASSSLNPTKRSLWSLLFIGLVACEMVLL